MRLILYRLEFGHPVMGVRQLVLPLKKRFAEVLDVLLPALEFLHSESVLLTVAEKHQNQGGRTSLISSTCARASSTSSRHPAST